ncbi:MAG: DUF2098 domain-containing protein [Methanoregulaceae archaeon]|nr:DUF2098 domain-containing protein [Methanoregulaceae archaeon]
MNAEELVIGMQVRYPRTGTSGRVTRVEQQHGDLFAELDSTGLLYRVDQLMPAAARKEREAKVLDEDLERIKRERESLSDEAFREALAHSDQSCEGGG